MFPLLDGSCGLRSQGGSTVWHQGHSQPLSCQSIRSNGMSAGRFGEHLSLASTLKSIARSRKADPVGLREPGATMLEAARLYA